LGKEEGLIKFVESFPNVIRPGCAKRGTRSNGLSHPIIRVQTIGMNQTVRQLASSAAKLFFRANFNQPRWDGQTTMCAVND
jgi:hypothetical protein